MAVKHTPSLPASLDPQLKRTLEKIAESVDTGAGLRGAPEQRFIRVQDLLDMGLAKKLANRAQQLVAGGNLVSATAPIMDIPPKPEGFEVSGGIGIIFLSWDSPRFVYGNHAYTEIWRAEEDNLSNAVLIAQTGTSFAYVDSDVNYTKTYYYWIRFVSRAEVFGPWNDAVGTQGQTGQDPGELLELLTGEIRDTQLHQSLLEPIQLINAPGGLLEQIEQNTLGIATEAQNRAQALIAEAEARLEQIQDESEARALALQQEALARGAAITAVENAQQTVNDSVATQLTTVTAATNANTAGLQTEITTRTNQVNSLSQQMSTLTAGTNSQFDHVAVWYFDTGVEGWAGNGTPTTPTPGWIRPVNHATFPYLISPTGQSINGTQYTQIRLRVRKTGAPVWRGELRWIHSTDSTFEAVNKVAFVDEPTFVDGIANVTFVVDSSYWVGKTITRFSLYLSNAQTDTDYLEVDWVAVGRPSPGASSAALSDLQQTVADNYSALSQSITNTNATVANKADTSAVNALASRVTTAENTIVSQSNSLTNVQASLLNSAAIPSDFTNGLNDWTFSRHGAPTSVTSTATGTLVIDADLGRAIEINSFSTAGQNILTKGCVRVIPGRIYEVRARFKVVSSDGSVGFNLIAAMMPGDFSASLSPNFSAPNATIVTNGNVVELAAKFSTQAAAGFFTLTAGTIFFRYGLRLNTAESGLVFRVGSITCVDVTDANTLLGLSQANSSATSLLDARVVATENAITAQSTFANNLKSSLYPSCIIDNPTFIDWPTGQARPTGWQAFGTVNLGRHTGSYAFTGGSAVEFVTGTNNAGMYFDTTIAKAVDAYYFDVELTFTVTAGTSLAGAGVLVRWYATDATFVESTVRLNDIYAPGSFELNKKYTVKARVKKPNVVGKIFSFNRVYLMANYAGSGLGALTSKTIIFDSVLVLISDASADALQTLETRVTAAEGNLASQSSSITALQNSVANKAESSAVNALTTRVTAAEGTISSQGSAITTLQNNVAGKADASAVNALDSRVTAAESSLTSQASSITALQNDVAGKASSAALSSLDSRVSATESATTAQATAITQLQAVIPSNGNLIANSEFLDSTNGWLAIFGSSYTGLTSAVGQGTAIQGVNHFGVSYTLSSTSGYTTHSTSSSGAYKIPVIAGKKYCASGYMSGNDSNARGRMLIEWFNSSDAKISDVSGATIALALNSVTTLGGMSRPFVIGTAPAGAAYARVGFVTTATTTGTKSFRWTRAMLSEVADSITAPPPYVPGQIAPQVAAIKITAEAAAVSAAGAGTTADNALAVAQQADAAAQAASTALTAIASDNKLTPGEKHSIRLEWDTLVAEKPANDAQADLFGVSKSAYGSAFQSLANYLNGGAVWSSGIPSWIADANLSSTTDIVGSTFRSTFNAYYSARTSLLNAIAANAKTRADNAQAAAQQADDSAQEALTEASAANNLLADIASDNKLTPVEKQSVRQEWNVIAAEKTANDAQADLFGVSKAAYGTAFQALATYLNNGTAWSSGIPNWISDANLVTTTTIVGATFRTNFKNYYDARTALLNAIATNAKNRADSAQTTANSAVARWEVKTTVGDLTGGVGFYNDGIATRFAIHADQFYVYAPGAQKFGLVVDGGKVVMDGASIKNLSVTAAQMADLTVTSAKLANAIINDAKIGTLTVDTIIQADASEDYIQASSIPKTIAQSGTNGVLFTAFKSYDVLTSVAVPAKTRNRKNVGFCDVAIKCSATVNLAEIYYKLFEIASPFPAPSIIIYPVGGTSISTGPAYIANGVTNTSSTPPASLPSGWTAISAGNTVTARAADGTVLAVGVVSARQSAWQTQNLGGGNYAHYLHVEMSTYLRLATGTIASIGQYFGNILLDAGEVTDVVNFTANKLERLSTTLTASIRSGAARNYHLAIGTKTSSGVVTVESSRSTLLSLR